MLVLHATRSGDHVWPGRAYQRFKDATNMTDRMGALSALVQAHAALAEPALERFHAQFKGEALVIDKWFALQGRAVEHDGKTFARVKQLVKHADFTLKNPNRARSLIFSLCMFNPAAFHRTDAAGYVFWAEQVLALDAINPQVAGRLARVMDRWITLATPYRSAAREAIARVAAKAELSNDVREIIDRQLAMDAQAAAPADAASASAAVPVAGATLVATAAAAGDATTHPAPDLPPAAVIDVTASDPSAVQG
jgi:aminopeptidase N